MEFRKLVESDWEQYSALRLFSLVHSPKSFENGVDDESTLSNEQWINRVTPSKNAFMVGAFDGANLIGVAGFSQAHKEKTKHKSYLWGVFVKEEYRGKHVATHILNKLVNFASENLEISQIQLTVGSENIAAISLYRKIGFNAYGTEIDAIRVNGKSYDEALMVYAMIRMGGSGQNKLIN